MNSEQLISELFAGAVITYNYSGRIDKITAYGNPYSDGASIVKYIKTIHNFGYTVVGIEINDTIRKRIDAWIKENK